MNRSYPLSLALLQIGVCLLADQSIVAQGVIRSTECSEEQLAYPVCRPATINGNCRVSLSHEAPLSPPQIRVRPSSTVCIVIGKLASQNIYFEKEYKDVASPDPYVSASAALVPIIKTFVGNLTITTGLSQPRIVGLDAQSFDSRYRELEVRLANLTVYQSHLRRDLQSAKGMLESAEKRLDQLKNAPKPEYELLYRDSCALAKIESADPERASLRNGEACQVKISLPSAILAEAELEVLTKEVVEIRRETELAVFEIESKEKQSPDVLSAIQDLDSKRREDARKRLQPPSREALLEVDRIIDGLSDAIENHRQLKALSQALEDARTKVNQALTRLPRPQEAKWVASFALGDLVASMPYASRGLNREASVKVLAQDVMSQDKKLLMTVSARWGESRWELSTGLLFSNLPSRAFANSIQFADGLPAVNRYRVTESKSVPLIVPAALVHYRLWEVGSKHRVAVLMTGGSGVNTSSSSADFAGGLSISWRSLVLSGLLHGTRDVGLSNGYSIGMELQSGTPAPTTERRWVNKFAVGISYRIPIP